MFISASYCQTDMLKYTKRKYCGDNLSKTLSIVCKGNYNTLTKKSDVIEKKGYWSPIFNPEYEETRFPFTRKSRAVSMMKFYQRRRKRGVFNECCEKACSHRELSYYCGH